MPNAAVVTPVKRLDLAKSRVDLGPPHRRHLVLTLATHPTGWLCGSIGNAAGGGLRDHCGDRHRRRPRV
jgi:hypothetical protein